MADPKYKTGDTWPPLSGTVSDDGGPVNISTADSLRVILKLDSPITTKSLPATNLDVGTPETRGKWEAPLAIDTFDNPGEWDAEVEVTWDGTSTPPEIETYPNDAANNPKIHVTSDLD